VVVWVAAPAMIRAGSTTAVMTVLLVAFLFEYLPKIYHSVRVLRRMQDASGYVFGTIWWGIALNLMAYFVAAHVSSRPDSSPFTPIVFFLAHDDVI
jgi:putative effector of murein hydrolase